MVAKVNANHPSNVNRTYQRTAAAKQARTGRKTTHMSVGYRNTTAGVRRGTLIGAGAGALVFGTPLTIGAGAYLGHRISVNKNPNRIGKGGRVLGGRHAGRAANRTRRHAYYVKKARQQGMHPQHYRTAGGRPRTARQAAASRRNLQAARRRR
jgi:hypothetical protein